MKPGWTGIVFLIHDSNPGSKHGRVYTHSHATRGVGQQIEAALKDKLFKTMKNYLFGMKLYIKSFTICCLGFTCLIVYMIINSLYVYMLLLS